MAGIDIRAVITGLIIFSVSYISYAVSDPLLVRIKLKAVAMGLNAGTIAFINTIMNILHYSLLIIAGMRILYILLHGLRVDTTEDYLP
jgi:hypothetical protein